MIHKTEMIQLLLDAFAACPDFAQHWEENRWMWEEHDGAEPTANYPAMSVLAHFIVNQVDRREAESLRNVFHLIDTLIQGGDEPTMLLTTMGLLEDVQTIASNQLVEQDDLLALLGPSARVAWDIIEEFWRRRGSLMDVLHGERRSGVGMGDVLIGRLRPDLN